MLDINILKEYESSDEEGRMKLVYAHFGCAVYWGQCVEASCLLMIIANKINKSKDKFKENVNRIIDTVDSSKKTLGTLINEIKVDYELAPEFVDKLNNLLSDRNYLIHKYFIDNIGLSYSDAGRRKMIEYFCGFIEKSKNVDAKLGAYYDVYIKKFGITDEIICDEMEKLRNKEP